MENDKLLPPREVARLLGVDPKTVSRWAMTGKIPSLRTPGGHRRYRKSVIDAILNSEA
jgi:excisionase family DNA binding protein